MSIEDFGKELYKDEAICELAFFGVDVSTHRHEEYREFTSWGEMIKYVSQITYDCMSIHVLAHLPSSDNGCKVLSVETSDAPPDGYSSADPAYFGTIEVYTEILL